MDVRVHGKNIRVKDEVSDVAIDKISKAGRIFDDGAAVADVEFSERRNPRSAGERFRVEITTRAAGRDVRVESTAPEPVAALDLAIDRFERQLRRLKERLIQRSRNREHKILNDVATHSDEHHEAGPPSIMRTKRFELRPMAPEEAVLQMEMLQHDFFFFLNAETGNYCVLYHRNDGSLGLIEPE